MKKVYFWYQVHSSLKISLNLDINDEKWFYTAFMLFLACFKVGRYLESEISLFYMLKYKYFIKHGPTKKVGLLVGP